LIEKELRAELWGLLSVLRNFHNDMCTMSWTLRQQALSNMYRTDNNNARQRMLRVLQEVRVAFDAFGTCLQFEAEAV
jgi:hypothetical protein